jgi:hypothetical protein
MAEPKENSKRQPSVWRQTAVVFAAVKNALINGAHMLGGCLRNWDAIAYRLSEPPRKRSLQISRFTQAHQAPG